MYPNGSTKQGLHPHNPPMYAAGEKGVLNRPESSMLEDEATGCREQLGGQRKEIGWGSTGRGIRTELCLLITCLCYTSPSTKPASLASASPAPPSLRPSS